MSRKCWAINMKVYTFGNREDMAPKAKNLIILSEKKITIPNTIIIHLENYYECEIRKYYDVYAKRALDIFSQTDLVIFRPCICGEDGQQNSFAGMMESCILPQSWMDLDGFMDVTGRAMALVETGRYMRDYMKKRGVGLHEVHDLTCIFQEYIIADKAGVLFTKDPVNGKDKIIIEATFGQNTPITDGKIDPDRYIVNKQRGIEACHIGRKEYITRIEARKEVSKKAEQSSAPIRVLDNQEISNLCTVAERVEKTFGTPQDIEWVIQGNEIFVLQARPITT